jgi:hypothetical protein
MSQNIVIYSKFMERPYRDFTMIFPTPRNQFPRPPIVIHGEFSTALAEGLREGFLFSTLSVADATPDFNEAMEVENSQHYFRDHPEEPETYFKEVLHDEPLNRKSLIRLHPDRYILPIYLRIPNPMGHYGPQLTIEVYVFPLEIEVREFLQGFLTILQAFHIDPERALPVAPFRNNQDYAIRGMNLPLLR